MDCNGKYMKRSGISCWRKEGTLCKGVCQWYNHVKKINYLPLTQPDNQMRNIRRMLQTRILSSFQHPITLVFSIIYIFLAKISRMTEPLPVDLTSFTKWKRDKSMSPAPQCCYKGLEPQIPFQTSCVHFYLCFRKPMSNIIPRKGWWIFWNGSLNLLIIVQTFTYSWSVHPRGWVTLSAVLPVISVFFIQSQGILWVFPHPAWGSKVRGW